MPNSDSRDRFVYPMYILIVFNVPWSSPYALFISCCAHVYYRYAMVRYLVKLTELETSWVEAIQSHGDLLAIVYMYQVDRGISVAFHVHTYTRKLCFYTRERT